MKVPQMIAAEFRRLTANPMSIVALIALVAVPILYGGLYLWANQDPYARLNQIPAAIVVDDSGTTVNGKSVEYGTEIADELVKDGTFDWHVVSGDSAASGVDDSKYDFSVTFPSDFSEALASASGSTPRQATVTLTTNDTNSYLASTIGQQAAEKIRVSIVKKVNEQAAQQFLMGLATIRSGLVTATDGAAQLVDGTTTAQAGAKALADGTAKVSTGASQLASGTAQVASGADQVADGARKVAAGNAELAAKADQAGAAANQVAGAIPQARQAVIDRLTAAGATQAQIDAALAALDPLGAKVAEGNAQVQTLVGQVDQLSAGANQVAAGSAQVAAGANQSADGATQLASGAQQTASGASTLNDGIGALHAGSAKLHDGLSDAVAKIPDNSAELQKKQAATIADPVQLANTSITSAGTYGAGLAPFFVALAAWIGIYALFLIVKPVSRRAITALHSPIKVTLAGWLTPGLLGAIQMIGLFAIVWAALRFPIANPVGMFGMMTVASLTFAAIILALNVWLGSVGQFLGLVLMVLQLVTAGGTFPWQTLPGPLAALHHVLPMSYAVDGIRQLMYGGNPATAWADAGVLGLWALIALVVAAIGVTRMTHFRTLRDLRPSLIG